MFEAFLYKKDNDTIWIDHDARITDQIKMHFKRYLLRSQVQLSNIEDHNVVNSEKNDADSTLDPRLNLLGHRCIVQSDQLKDIQLENESKYNELRFKLGIPEGNESILFGQSLPLESNFDLLNGSKYFYYIGFI